jgi:hypothetical protein
MWWDTQKISFTLTNPPTIYCQYGFVGVAYLDIQQEYSKVEKIIKESLDNLQAKSNGEKISPQMVREEANRILLEDFENSKEYLRQRDIVIQRQEVVTYQHSLVTY